MELLNLVKAFIYDEMNVIESQSSTLLDLVFILDIFFNEDENLKICYFKDYEWKEKDPIFQYFKRVYSVNFTSYKDAITKLNMIEQASITNINQLYFDELNTNEFEKITNPKYFNYKIQSIK